MYLTLDAIIAGMLVISLLLLFVQPELPSFKEVIVYSQLQDMVEVCTLKMDFSPECFSVLKKKVPGIEYAVYLNGIKVFGDNVKEGIVIERRYFRKHLVVIGK